LAEAAGFYNGLLLSNPEKYSEVLTYLARQFIRSLHCVVHLKIERGAFDPS
jgi:hypothetical protein